MASEHELAALRDRVHHLESQVTAVRAVVNAGPDYRRRCTDGVVALRALLALPTTRPGSWEAEPVTKLQDELRDVLHTLEGDGGGAQ